MTPWKIIVVALPDSPGSADHVRSRLLEAWTASRPLEIRTTTIDKVDDVTPATDAVVLVGSSTGDARRVLGRLASLEEAGVAVLALLAATPDADSPYVFGGTLIEMFEQDDQVLCAKLEGMLHRQETVKRLQTEVSIAHRCHGGLQGEIARMHEELQLAAMVQREFLPRELPNLYGIDFAALWRPAHYVSGDIYDICRLDDDHVGVFIADAVGHGVPAALMTMVICRSLTTKIITGNSYRLIEPEEVLARLNRDMIRRQGRTTRFATAVYAIVNCRSREVRLAGAGHPPPLLLGADGSSRAIEPAGGLLGVFEDETYEQVSFEVSVGDRLLMYSDGFEQAFPAAQADAYERKLPNDRYREEFEQLAASSSPKQMVTTISQRLDDQAGSLHQLDDLTMLCMRAGPIISAADATEEMAPETTGNQIHLA
jgi:sigma-B regulation protein RsbU (phosphoserine phosphatase)